MSFAKECLVSVAYNFGEENPAMIYVLANGLYSSKIMEVVEKYFDFRPRVIIERLNLKSVKYLPTSIYGYFTGMSYPWEQIEKI